MEPPRAIRSRRRRSPHLPRPASLRVARVPVSDSAPAVLSPRDAQQIAEVHALATPCGVDARERRPSAPGAVATPTRGPACDERLRRARGGLVALGRLDE